MEQKPVSITPDDAVAILGARMAREAIDMAVLRMQLAQVTAERDALKAKYEPAPTADIKAIK